MSEILNFIYKYSINMLSYKKQERIYMVFSKGRLRTKVIIPYSLMNDDNYIVNTCLDYLNDLLIDYDNRKKKKAIRK